MEDKEDDILFPAAETPEQVFAAVRAVAGALLQGIPKAKNVTILLESESGNVGDALFFSTHSPNNLLGLIGVFSFKASQTLIMVLTQHIEAEKNKVTLQ